MKREGGRYLAVTVVIAATVFVHLLWMQALRAVSAGAQTGIWPDVAFGLHQLWFFNPVLWQGAQAYPGGAVLMFVTHGFVHSGWEHLIWNMLPLVPLGIYVCRRVGQIGFLALYFGAMVVAAGVYALTARHGAAMFGASGAVYGLGGAVWLWSARDAAGWLGRWVIPALVGAALVALNLWFLSRGIAVAWTLHLGGFLFGAAIAMATGRRGAVTDAGADAGA